MKKTHDKELLNYYFNKFKLYDFLKEDVFNLSDLHYFKRNDFILEANTKLNYLYILVEGSVKISYLFESGTSIFLKFYEGLNFMGDLELIQNIDITCDIVALNDVTAIAIPAEFLRKKYFNNPLFLMIISRSLSEKLYGTINNSSYNYAYPLINRLASFLQEQYKGDIIKINYSFQELAQFLGTSYRHLNRAFNELEKRKIIRRNKKNIEILDIKSLKSLSKNFYIKSL